MSPNTYSPEWFEFFHRTIPAARTERECAFVRRVCPLPLYRRILDVCCGMGRHAHALAGAGYQVTGIERDAEAVRVAERQESGAVFQKEDIRGLQPAEGSFDGVIIMSQSFGFFDDETNLQILTRLAKGLRESGRVVLDLWNPAFFSTRLEPRWFDLPAGRVLETKSLTGDRLAVRLDYPGGGYGVFEWRTFSEDQMAALARRAGLRPLFSAADYDASVFPSPDKPKIQFVLERL